MRGLAWGSATVQGRRSTNEDRLVCKAEFDGQHGFFAVYDGHSGAECSIFLQTQVHSVLAESPLWPQEPEEAVRSAFIALDQAYLETGNGDGSTALVCITLPQYVLLANLGDCRAVKSSRIGNIAEPLTVDHKPHHIGERARIEAARRTVTLQSFFIGGQQQFISRIDGRLAVSRSFGDRSFKDADLAPHEQALSCVPEITRTTLAEGEFIVLASDGLWDVLSNNDVVEFVQSEIETLPQQSVSSANQALTAVAQNLCQLAVERRSSDNVTAIIVFKSF